MRKPRPQRKERIRAWTRGQFKDVQTTAPCRERSGKFGQTCEVAVGSIAPLTIDAAGQSSVVEVLQALGTRSDGLTSAEASARLEAMGRNVLEVRTIRTIAILGRQIRNPILILLLLAALVSGLTGESSNAVIIGVIVSLSVGLGFFNEYAAAVAMASLRSHISQTVVVRRDGVDKVVPTEQLVPGDVITLRIGSLVPADVRLLTVNDFETDEAVLTGESLPVAKVTSVCSGSQPQDLVNCAFMGTVVRQGAGTAVVVETGRRTAFGAVASGLGQPTSRTSFEAGLARFSRFLFSVAAVLTAFVFAMNTLLHQPLVEAMLFSLAIAVGIAPEMMPAIVTTSLSAGSRALAAKNVLVKRLAAIEDIGNVEVLFTDKTGTLTDGTITFERALDPDGERSDFALLLGLVCNEATWGESGPVGGNALDVALWQGLPGGRSHELAIRAESFARLSVLPFDHDRRLASVLVKGPDGESLMVTKGAPEAILARCSPSSPKSANVLHDLFTEGSRVVAVATRTGVAGSSLTPEDERNLHLDGFLVFADRVKPGVAESLETLHGLGVEVKIITGDNELVARRVCQQIGLPVRGSHSGDDLELMTDNQLGSVVAQSTIFARVGPQLKARIIAVARRDGRDVAYLGDGVNDAVALHHADVGISVDSATDVAKEAADVILLDKDLGVLADGVVEGRRIFANTMKYVLMSTSSNFGNMFSAAGASVFIRFLPMLPGQILLNNLLYNSGQLVIPTDRVDPEALARPAAWDMRFIRNFMSVFGPISSVFDFATFFVMLKVLHAGHSEFRTGWFIESLATQTLVIFVIRTRRVPFTRSRPSAAMILVPVGAAVLGSVLPYTGLARVLGFTPLPLRYFSALFIMIVVYLALVEGAKKIFFRNRLSVVQTHRAPVSPAQRHAHRVRRRASRFTSHDRPRRRTAQRSRPSRALRKRRSPLTSS